ncbi:MAG: O-antigen ligase family protein, partial [Bacteroidales bacterium]|nr:O-antigen ligase family protein [Bacteroidales bacterium]
SAITLELIMLLLMQTRAQWLAVVGLLLLTAILAILIPGVRHAMRDSGGRRALLLAGLSLFLAIGTASLLTRASLSAARKQQQEIPAEGKAITGLGERAASIVDNTTENRKTRLVIWKYTWEMIQDKPWLGVGAGNWKLVAPMYYDKDYMTTYYHNWRRPHNDFLQVAAEKGIPALMVYLAFFVMLALRGIRYLMRSENKARILQVLFALGGLAGYSIDSMFSFSYERVDEGMMMMLFAGIIIKADMEIRQLPVKAIQTRKPWVTYAIPAFLLLCLPPGLSWVRGEIATKEAYAYNNAGRWAEAVRAIDKSYGKLNQIDPSNNPLLWFRGKAHMQMGHMDQARMDLETALVQKPGSITVLTELGVLFGRMGEHTKAVEVLKEAHEILPSDRLVLFNLGLAYYKMNRYRDALDYLYPCLTDKEDTQLNSLIRDAEEKLFGPRLAEEGAGQEVVPG